MTKADLVEQVAEAIGPRLARDTVAGLVDGELVDLRTALTTDVDLRIVTVKDPEAGEVIRHSAEHVMADAVKRLWPGTPIDAGRQDHSEKYQYDFRFPRGFTAEDLERIEEKMREILAEDSTFERVEIGRGVGRALETIEVGGDGVVEEERRLCYVGVTRAEDRLALSFPLTRMKWGKARETIPSRFLYELTGQADNPGDIARMQKAAGKGRKKRRHSTRRRTKRG